MTYFKKLPIFGKIGVFGSVVAVHSLTLILFLDLTRSIIRSTILATAF